MSNDFKILYERFSRVFGAETVYTIDYYGALAAHRDIADVFICEVLKTNCNAKLEVRLRAQSAYVNLSENLTEFMANKFLESYAKSRLCNTANLKGMNRVWEVKPCSRYYLHGQLQAAVESV